MTGESVEGARCRGGCGTLLGARSPGYCSRKCAAEHGAPSKRKHMKRTQRRQAAAVRPHPHNCQHCTKRFRFLSALAQHTRDVHQ